MSDPFDRTRLVADMAGAATAPPVVLLHAIATSGALWAPQIPVWAQAFRLLIPDIRGHGRSAVAGHTTLDDLADDVAALLDRSGIERAAIVGLSLGGMVAQTFALRYPGRVTALVLAHTSARTPDPLKAVWQDRIERVRGAGMDAELAGTLERWFTPGFRENAPMTVNHIAALVRATPPEGFVDAAAAIQGLDTLDRLSEIKVPALVLCGAEDKAATPAAGQAMADRIPGSRFAILAGAAHLGNIEKPVAFTEQAGAFLAGVLEA